MKIIVNGAPGAGKTIFEKMIRYLIGNDCKIISTIDFVKDLAYLCGWNGEKTPENRKFLSDLKDLLTQWDNVPYKKVLSKIKKIEAEEYESYGVAAEPNLLFFIDSREPEEIARFKNELGATTLLIRRASAELKETSNHADAQVLNFAYDVVIDNNGSLADLWQQAYKFLDFIKFEDKIHDWRRRDIQLTIDGLPKDFEKIKALS